MAEGNNTAPAPAATPAAPAPAQNAPASGGGKSGSSKVIIIVVVIIVVLGVIGYAAQRYFARKLADKTASSLLGAATGGKVSVDSNENGGVSINSNGDTAATGSKAVWPKTMPTDVPEYKAGTITYSSSSSDSSSKSWVADFSGASESSFTSYQAEIVAKAWSETDRMTSGQSTSVSYENTTYRLSVTFDSEQKTLGVTVYNK